MYQMSTVSSSPISVFSCSYYVNVRRSVISFDRKYFSSTPVSKMSDNEHSFPVLRDSEIFRVKQIPLRIIPEFIQGSEDGLERISVVMVEQSFDVLKE